MKNLTIMSYNIHKGFSRFRKLEIHRMKEKIQKWNPDIIFLQEVQGKHGKHEKNKLWPEEPQYDFLGNENWKFRAYGANKFYELGHHGNAILSKYPLKEVFNYDISTSKYEKRGVLYAVTHTSIGKIHLLCTHLSLTKKARDWQCEKILEILKSKVMDGDKVILGGDFNDWTNRTKKIFSENMNYIEALSLCNNGKPLKSFPSEYPLLSLDKLFIKGLIATKGNVMKDHFRVSDHAPVFIELTI